MATRAKELSDLGNSGHLNVHDDGTVTLEGGSVGIGTTSPDTPLHVRKAGNPNGGNRNTVETVLTLDATGYYPYGGYGVGIDFKGEDYGNTAIREYAKIEAVMVGHSNQTAAGDSAFTSALTFATNSGGASSTLATEKMRIDDSGNVGIGVTDPDIKLHTQIDTATEWTGTANLSNTTNKPIFALLLDNNDSSITNTEVNMLFSAGASGSGQHSIGVKRTGTNTGDMIFRRRTGGSSSAETMRINSSGNVGIGTTSPGKKLDVNGEARITTGLTITPATSNVYATDSTLSSYATGNGVYLNGHGSGWLRLNASGANRASIDMYGENYAAPWTDAIVFKTGNTGNRMMIATNGNVGIGTTSPQGKLHIDQGHLLLKKTMPVASPGTDFDFIEMQYGGGWSNNQGGLASISATDATGVVGRFGVTYRTGSGDTGGSFVVSDLYQGGYGASGEVFEVNNDRAIIPSVLNFSNTKSSSFIQNTSGNVLEIRSDNQMEFFTYSGSWQKRMVISDDGKVGIGTDNPSANFDVRVSRTDTDPLIGLFSQQSGGADARVMISTSANNNGDPYLKFDAGGTNMIVGEFWKGTNNNELRMGPGERPSDSNFRGLRVDGGGQTFDESGVVGPMFYIQRNYANHSGSGASSGTWGTGHYYTDLTSDGDFLNLKDHTAGGLQSWLHGNLAPVYQNSTWRQDIRGWGALRIIFVASRTGNSYSTTSVVFNYKRYFYSAGWTDASSSYDTTFTGTDSDRGRRWCAMPWIDHGDFSNGADVPGLGIVMKTSNGVNMRIGACYVQYRYKNASSGV